MKISNQRMIAVCFFTLPSFNDPTIMNDQALTPCLAVENALKESEERFRQMAEMTGEWLWEQDAKGFYLYSSNAVQQIVGWSPDAVIGTHYTALLTPCAQTQQQAYATSRQPFYGLTNQYRHQDGHLVYTESTGLPILDAQGQLIKWRGVDRDITARKHYHDALIESEQRTRQIIESALSAIVIMDAYGLITDWNYRAELMFGWTAQEAVGQRLAELIIPPRLRSAHQHGLQQFLLTGTGTMLNQLLEQVALRRDGSEFPVEISVAPLKQGNTYLFSGFINDISARKAAEQRIRAAEINWAVAQNELGIAQRIQASLSPSAPLKSAQFAVTGYCLPAAQVGGDYFDYFYRSDNVLDLVIADVSGHSIGPALFMVETRSAILTQAKHSSTPAQTLALLNSFMFADLDRADYFITLSYLQYSVDSQQLAYANAGHPPPLLLRDGQGECLPLDAEGMVLGVRKELDFDEHTVSLSAGDVVLLYTDGLTEAENPEGDFFGVDRVCQTLCRCRAMAPEQIIAQLLDQLKQFCRSDLFKDDITLMVFKRS